MLNIKNPLELLAQDPVELSLISLKSKLMLILTKLIREKGWSQKEAAKVLGVSQPRVSNLMNSQISKFSIDMLLEMLGKIGYIMDISFDKDSNSPISVNVKRSDV